MKASMKLIQQLRGQLPPEAAESLDELESMAGDEGDEEDEGEEGGDDEMPDFGGMDDEAPAMPEDEEDLDVVPAVPMAGKSKAKKKPSFFS